jgi:hypothetical protein
MITFDKFNHIRKGCFQKIKNFSFLLLLINYIYWRVSPNSFEPLKLRFMSLMNSISERIHFTLISQALLKFKFCRFQPSQHLFDEQETFVSPPIHQMNFYLITK